MRQEEGIKGPTPEKKRTGVPQRKKGKNTEKKKPKTQEKNPRIWAYIDLGGQKKEKAVSFD